MPRGRPKGSKNKSTLIKEGLLDPKTLLPVDPEDKRTDEQVVQDTISRFDIFSRVVEGTSDGSIKSLVVSGAAGVGKTYTADWILNAARERNNNIRYVVKSGMVTGIELYKLAYSMRHEGNVIVLDDCDSIFASEDALNVLKACLDTSLVRNVSWLSNSAALKDDDGETPREFEYRGSMVFLTNKDFQAIIDGTGGSRAHVEHMQALMSRSLYLDLKMHTRREIVLWTKHVVTKNRILQKMGLSAVAEAESVTWLANNSKNLREISIRTALKLGMIRLVNPTGWEKDATALLLK